MRKILVIAVIMAICGASYAQTIRYRKVSDTEYQRIVEQNVNLSSIDGDIEALIEKKLIAEDKLNSAIENLNYKTSMAQARKDSAQQEYDSIVNEIKALNAKKELLPLAEENVDINWTSLEDSNPVRDVNWTDLEIIR